MQPGKNIQLGGFCRVFFLSCGPRVCYYDGLSKCCIKSNVILLVETEIYPQTLKLWSTVLVRCNGSWTLSLSTHDGKLPASDWGILKLYIFVQKLVLDAHFIYLTHASKQEPDFIDFLCLSKVKTTPALYDDISKKH